MLDKQSTVGGSQLKSEKIPNSFYILAKQHLELPIVIVNRRR
jgi:hypothetical protein